MIQDDGNDLQLKARKHEILTACLACKIAYLKTLPEIRNAIELEGFGTPDVEFFTDPLLGWIIIRLDDLTIVAFRGSSTWREWLNNLHVWPQNTIYGTVHAGFFNTLRRFFPILLTHIEPDIKSRKRLILTGHSRGGAIAVLVGAVLAAHGQPVHGITTFAAPMAGGEGLRKLLAGTPAKAYVNGPDPVPKFPMHPHTNNPVFKRLLRFKPIYIFASLSIYAHYVFQLAPLRVWMRRIFRVSSRNSIG